MIITVELLPTILHYMSFDDAYKACYRVCQNFFKLHIKHKLQLKITSSNFVCILQALPDNCIQYLEMDKNIFDLKKQLLPLVKLLQKFPRIGHVFAHVPEMEQYLLFSLLFPHATYATMQFGAVLRFLYHGKFEEHVQFDEEWRIRACEQVLLNKRNDMHGVEYVYVRFAMYWKMITYVKLVLQHDVALISNLRDSDMYYAVRCGNELIDLLLTHNVPMHKILRCLGDARSITKLEIVLQHLLPYRAQHFGALLLKKMYQSMRNFCYDTQMWCDWLDVHQVPDALDMFLADAQKPTPAIVAAFLQSGYKVTWLSIGHYCSKELPDDKMLCHLLSLLEDATISSDNVSFLGLVRHNFFAVLRIFEHAKLPLQMQIDIMQLSLFGNNYCFGSQFVRNNAKDVLACEQWYITNQALNETSTDLLAAELSLYQVKQDEAIVDRICYLLHHIPLIWIEMNICYFFDIRMWTVLFARFECKTQAQQAELLNRTDTQTGDSVAHKYAVSDFKIISTFDVLQFAFLDLNKKNKQGFTPSMLYCTMPPCKNECYAFVTSKSVDLTIEDSSGKNVIEMLYLNALSSKKRNNTNRIVQIYMQCKKNATYAQAIANAAKRIPNIKTWNP